MGILYLVATPIGNLEDITLRALKVLRSVDLIAAEDTRTTKVLLKHYQIDTKLMSNHHLNEKSQIDSLLGILQSRDIALVSDAGTPVINDPGFPLVSAAATAGVVIIPIPGPSSPITAISASGLPADEFAYLGYFPKKSKERKDILIRADGFGCTIIFLETPHRLLSALKDMRAALGNRRIAICREMTKLYEEILRGTLDEVIDHFEKTQPLGEFTLVLAPRPPEERWTDAFLTEQIIGRIKEHKKPVALAKELAEISGWSRKEIYEKIQSLT